MSASTVRFGILGAGYIAQRIREGIESVEGAELVAVSGRSPEKLAAFAPVRAYADGADGSAAHRQLLADPEVDAVYIALPHAMHLPWVLEALRAGKAVICEKPAFLTEAEASEAASVAAETGTLFMEAMKCRFVPLHQKVLETLGTGRLGRVVEVRCRQRVDYGEHGLSAGYLTNPVGGGALYDLGCYPMSWVEEFTAGEPDELRVREVRMFDAGRGPVDWAGVAEMRFGDVAASVDWAGDADEYECTCELVCEHGSVFVEKAHRPERAVVRYADGGRETLEAPYDPNDFHGELAHFCELVRAGAAESPVMPLAATKRNALLLDLVRAGF